MSSIVYDKNLIEQLLKIEANVKISKAQNVDIANLKKMVEKLEQEAASLKSEIDPQTILDNSIPETLDERNPGALGENYISLVNLLTPEAFNAWLKSNSISIYLNGKAITYDDIKYDPKVALRALNNRVSKFLLPKAIDAETKYIYEEYKKQIENLLSSMGSEVKSSSIDKDRYFKELSQMLPFNSQTIDFGSIRRFLDKYSSYVANNTSSERAAEISSVMQSVDQANQFMDNASNQTLLGRQAFPINFNTSPNEVKTWLKPPSGEHYLTLLDQLKMVLSSTYNALNDLKKFHANEIGEGNLRGQDSIYSIQLNKLQSLENAIK